MRNILVKVNVCVNKNSGVVDWGLGWGKKVGIRLGSVVFYPNFIPASNYFKIL